MAALIIFMWQRDDDELALSFVGAFPDLFVWDAPLNTDLVKQLVAVFCIAFNIDQMCSIIKSDHALTWIFCFLESSSVHHYTEGGLIVVGQIQPLSDSTIF